MELGIQEYTAEGEQAAPASFPRVPGAALPERLGSGGSPSGRPRRASCL